VASMIVNQDVGEEDRVRWMDEAESPVVTGDISRFKRGVGACAQPVANGVLGGGCMGVLVRTDGAGVGGWSAGRWQCGRGGMFRRRPCKGGTWF